MHTTDGSSGDEQLAAYAEALIEGLAEYVPRWVEHLLSTHLGAEEGSRAARRHAPDVDGTMETVAALLRSDIDDQHANPLAVIRTLIGPITQTLADAGVEPPHRDPDAVRIFPGDHFDLVPATFGDVHENLHTAGLTWGAAKAHVHLRRRRNEGLRP